MTHSIALLALAATAAAPEDAALRFMAGDAEFRAAVVAEGARGPVLSITCSIGCPAPLRYTEAVDNVLGLFQLSDAEGLLLSTWATGSAYRVRAYRVTAGSVTKVLDASSLGTVGLVPARGGLTIQTTERRTERSPRSRQQTVSWRWTGTRFVRQQPSPTAR